MNDILAPLFAVFLAEKFSLTYVELENRLVDVVPKLSEDILLAVHSLGRSGFVFLFRPFIIRDEGKLSQRFRRHS